MINKYICVVLLYICVIYIQPSYIWWYPNLYYLHDDSFMESKKILPYMKKDKSLFYKTDMNAYKQFKELLPNESMESIRNVATSQDYIIYFLKYIINRPRPSQINKKIKALPSKTAITPSFPSGHTYQSFLIAKYYSKKYPEIKDKLYLLAEECGEARIRAGLHYPSDHKASKWLVHLLN